MLAAAAALGGDRPVILVLGDSLSAGWGLPRDAGWVQLLAERLAERGHPHRVVNASASGETSQGGLARLPALLEKHRPAVVILELGGNDGLRGLPPAALEANLRRMVALCREAGAAVILLGIRLPANYGPAYRRAFEQVFARVAAEAKLPWLPFFLEGVADDPALMQDDGIHPNAAAQPRLLDNVWPLLEPLLGAQSPATVSDSTSTEGLWTAPRRSTSAARSTRPANICARLPAMVIS